MRFFSDRLYVRQCLCAWEVSCDTDFCQLGGIELKGRGKDNMFFYNVYRSPNNHKLFEWIGSLSGQFALEGDLKLG